MLSVLMSLSLSLSIGSCLEFVTVMIDSRRITIQWITANRIYQHTDEHSHQHTFRALSSFFKRWIDYSRRIKNCWIYWVSWNVRRNKREFNDSMFVVMWWIWKIEFSRRSFSEIWCLIESQHKYKVLKSIKKINYR